MSERPALYEAACVGDVAAMRRLLDEAGDGSAALVAERVDYFGDTLTALHIAALRGWTAAAELLLERGADANDASPIRKQTPLAFAASVRVCIATDYGVSALYAQQQSRQGATRLCSVCLIEAQT